jgi:hypothetical protein
MLSTLPLLLSLIIHTTTIHPTSVRPASDPGPTITVGGVTLKHCINEYDGYCGYIPQPFDRHTPSTRTITIGFEFYPHTDRSKPSLGVILAQEGGPGFDDRLARRVCPPLHPAARSARHLTDR